MTAETIGAVVIAYASGLHEGIDNPGPTYFVHMKDVEIERYGLWLSSLLNDHGRTAISSK